MPVEHAIYFQPFTLDLINECLWRESERITLRPKTFAVLCYLVRHAERLVTRDELQTSVWGETIVSETVLRGCIREIRAALGDDSSQPQFIETVPRRGYRFLAPTTASPVLVSDQLDLAICLKTENDGHETDRNQLRQPAVLRRTVPLIGREAELASLAYWLQEALNGQRQVVCVSGEPGIGKTALVETFLIRLDTRDTPAGVWIGQGQCIEHYGTGEAFGPVLEALARLCRGPQGASIVAVLETHAPSWLLQMPAFFTASRLESLRHKTAGTTRERMLREMGETLEVLSVEKPIVLVLEDSNSRLPLQACKMGVGAPEFLRFAML